MKPKIIKLFAIYTTILTILFAIGGYFAEPTNRLESSIMFVAAFLIAAIGLFGIAHIFSKIDLIMEMIN